ncbi:MAG: HyaD/HybD family hydrogenase maturation endopeptidase [Rudaea sp.]
MAVEVAYADQLDCCERLTVSVPCGAASVVMLGIGNVLLGDDGVGIQLVERLRSDPALSAVDFVDGGTLSFSLLGLIETTDALLVADAADLNLVPGTVRLFENEAMDRFLRSSRRRSVHEVGLCDLLDMARLHDCLPERRALLCVQPGTIDWGETLSDRLAETFESAVGQARSVLGNWCFSS